MSYITNPEPFDVLLGRGLLVNNFSGNVFFRQLINEHSLEYSTTRNRKRKNEISSKIHEIICEENGGRFLRELKTNAERASVGFVASSFERTTITSGVWIPVDDETSLTKIKHALRDAYIQPQESQTPTAGGHQSSVLNQEVSLDSATTSSLNQESSLASTSSTTASSQIPLLSDAGNNHNMTSNTIEVLNYRNSTLNTSALQNHPMLVQNQLNPVFAGINNFDTLSGLCHELSAMNRGTDFSQVLDTYGISQSTQHPLQTINTPDSSSRMAFVFSQLQQIQQIQQIQQHPQHRIDRNDSYGQAVVSYHALADFIVRNAQVTAPSLIDSTRTRGSNFSILPDNQQALQQTLQQLATFRLHTPPLADVLLQRDTFPRTNSRSLTAIPNFAAIGNYDSRHAIDRGHVPRLSSVIHSLLSSNRLNTTIPTLPIEILNRLENQNIRTEPRFASVVTSSCVEPRVRQDTPNSIEHQNNNTTAGVAGSFRTFHEMPNVPMGNQRRENLMGEEVVSTATSGSLAHTANVDFTYNEPETSRVLSRTTTTTAGTTEPNIRQGTRLSHRSRKRPKLDK